MSNNNVPFFFGQTTEAQPQRNHTTQQAPSSGQPSHANAQASSMAAPNMAAASGLDLGALQGISPHQLAIIAQMFQAGQLPLPPPAPTQSAPLPAAQTAKNAMPASARDVTKAMDVDREDGELEDGEVDDKIAPTAPLPGDDGKRASTIGIARSPPRLTARLPRTATEAGSSRAAPAAPAPRSSVINLKAQSNSNSNATLRSRKDAAAKAFVSEMYNNGYSYDQISKEVTDVQLLRRMYQQLDLPLASASTSQSLPAKAVVAKASSKPAAPLDRSAYLARLQAAKNKKPEINKTSATPPPAATILSDTALTPIASASPALQSPVPAVQPCPPVPRPVGLSKDKNDMIRQRLEALKAEQAAKKIAKAQEVFGGASGAHNQGGALLPQQSPSSAPAGLGAGLSEAASKAASEAAAAASTPASRSNSTPVAVDSTRALNVQNPAPSSPQSQGLNRTFGLPGLFTTFSLPASPLNPSRAAINTISPGAPSLSGASGLQPQPPIPAAPSSTSPLPQARAALHDGKSTGAQQRTFCQSRKSDDDTRYVIQVSSDEDDMNTDSSEEEIAHAAAQQPTSHNSNAPPVPHKLSLPKSELTSAFQTPTVSTPNADLKRKLEEIEETKRRIAEAERKRQRTAKDKADVALNIVPAVTAPPSQPQPSMPVLATDPSAQAFQSAFTFHGRSSDSQQLPEYHAESASTTTTTQQDKVEDSSVTPTAAPTDGARSAEDAVDDEDDEDLYGGAPVTGSSSDMFPDSGKIDSQATTVSVESVPRDTQSSSQPPLAQYETEAIDDDGDDFYEPQLELDNSVAASRAATKFGEEEHGSKGGDEIEDDLDDDLDDVYEPQQTSSSMVVTDAPRTQGYNAVSADRRQESDDAVDTSDMSSTDSHDESDFTPEPAAESVLFPEAAQTQHENGSGASDDTAEVQQDSRLDDADLAPELQPSPAELTVPSEKLDQSHQTSTFFTPYESPLQHFKDYRYHPDFANIVPSGFRSLTYTHKIDPVKAVCPTELEQGQCDNAQCDFQHFQDMKLKDNDLLRLMGTEQTPARTPEEEKKWKEGLSALIKQLRQTNVGKDVGVIAQYIADYRRSFIDDPARILLLRD